MESVPVSIVLKFLLYKLKCTTVTVLCGSLPKDSQSVYEDLWSKLSLPKMNMEICSYVTRGKRRGERPSCFEVPVLEKKA